MARGLAYKRWRQEVKTARVRKRIVGFSYWDRSYFRSYGFKATYQKKNSITETVTVEIKTESHHKEYLNFRARKERDNPKLCSCCWCCNPRQASGNSNSSHAITRQEGAAITFGVMDIEDCDTNTPHFRWKSRKYRTHPPLRITDVFDETAT